MEEDLRYGKRKKKKVKTPNPLFEMWLREWKEEAAEKGIKSQYVYAKALKSLQRYPLLLTSGKDCKILENFGDKLCKMLEDRLQKHIQEHGVVVPPEPDTLTSRAPSTAKAPARQKAKASQNAAATGKRAGTQGGGHQRVTHALSDSDSEGGTGAPPPPRKRQRSGMCSGEREYIPAYRSGPYALLIALHRDRQSADGRGFMSKTELCNQAQALADTSFTVADPGCRYTAWSSMGTLIKKGLVTKESSPAKYSLTEAGCDLAHRLEMSQADDYSDNQIAAQRAPAGIPEATSQITGQLQYKYVTNEGNEVISKDKAAVLIEDDFGLGFLIKVNYQKLLTSGKRYRLDTTRPLDEDVYVYLHGDDTDELAINRSTPRLPSLDQVDLQEPVTTEKPRKEVKKRTKTPKDVMSLATAEPQLISFQSSSPRPTTNTLGRVHSQGSWSTSENSQDSLESTTSTCVPNFVFQPGEFEIILCVDNAEFYGSRQGGGKSLLPDLIKNGVTCDLRKLHVGDLLWVAREKTQTEAGVGQQPRRRELVLDYIVERKRMDDLVHSCTDGRLPDQKFRLKHCGLKKPIFMIEDYGSLQHFSMPEDRIRQTITNLKVIDGFQVKRTKNVKESVAYLTVMTRYLQSYYKNKQLYACSMDDVKDQAWTNDITDQEIRLMEFNEFNQGSVKSRNLCVQDMFCKHLSKVSGMSGERAMAVTQVYPTLTHLMDAYRWCPNKSVAESLLSTIKVNKSLRNLGINPSRLIHQLYTTPGALT